MTEGLSFERLRDVEEDLTNLYSLKSEPHDIYWSGYTSRPDRSEFKTWFAEQIRRADREIWLVKRQPGSGKALGYLYMTYEWVNGKRIGWISHGVSESFAGKGIGTAIVHFAVNLFLNDLIKIDEIQAWIVKENIPSEKTFTRNGFLKSSLFKEEFYKSVGGQVILENYFLKKPGAI